MSGIPDRDLWQTGYFRDVSQIPAGDGAVTPQGTFDIGLVMAGAVSAGAYTAGVLDLLTQALDEWESAKAKERETEPDPTKWLAPGHSVRIRIVSGASAGAVTAAIAATAWRTQFPHVSARNGSLSEDAKTGNLFYSSWVRGPSLDRFLETKDFDDGKDVWSALDCTVLTEVCTRVLTPAPPSQPVVARPYLANPTRFVFSIGNLDGTPFEVEMQTENPNNTTVLTQHRDRCGYAVQYNAGTACTRKLDDTRLEWPLDASNQSWHMFGEHALASAAFPIGLASRLIDQPLVQYEQCQYAVLGNGLEADIVRLKPFFWIKTEDDRVRKIAAVDGGTMDNEPLDLARTELSGLTGRNPRNGIEANRGVIMIDPFPNFRKDKPDAVNMAASRPNVIAQISKLIGTWTDQARFSQEDVALSMDPDVYSRFLIAPNRDTLNKSNKHHLACGTVGGFGGFVSEAFRHHDYLLGRRNAQKFLREVFTLPVANTSVFAGHVNPALLNDRTANLGWVVQTKNGSFEFPIIPLVGALKNQVEDEPEWPEPYASDDYQHAATVRVFYLWGRLQSLATREMKLPMRLLIGVLGNLSRLLASGWIAQAILDYVKKDLQSANLYKTSSPSRGSYRPR